LAKTLSPDRNNGESGLRALTHARGQTSITATKEEIEASTQLVLDTFPGMVTCDGTREIFGGIEIANPSAASFGRDFEVAARHALVAELKAAHRIGADDERFADHLRASHVGTFDHHQLTARGSPRRERFRMDRRDRA